ncbi:MAG TPA: response regulator [Pyrinomonadaceae bacterium]|nr:response regulator [Pyrinomonadaceae bacterium]
MTAKPRVMFVEDHPDTQAILTHLLEQSGFDVTAVRTVADALELARDGRFDAFVLNHVFPDASGVTLCRELRAMGRAEPIIFFSAAAHESEIRIAFEAGADEYLKKPGDIVNLAGVVARRLKKS